MAEAGEGGGVVVVVVWWGGGLEASVPGHPPGVRGVPGVGAPPGIPAAAVLPAGGEVRGGGLGSSPPPCPPWPPVPGGPGGCSSAAPVPGRARGSGTRGCPRGGGGGDKEILPSSPPPGHIPPSRSGRFYTRVHVIPVRVFSLILLAFVTAQSRSGAVDAPE